MIEMKSNLLEVFLEEDCDGHARSALLAALDMRPTALDRQEFSFNRFNAVLDFVGQQAVIDDELNPEDGEFVVAIDEFRRRVEAAE